MSAPGDGPGRSWPRLRLRTRLLVSYLIVIAAGGGVTYLIVRLLAPRLFDERMGLGPGGGRGVGGMGGSSAGQGPAIRDAFRSALNVALLVGLAASVLLAGVLALWAGFRLVKPLTDVRAATRRVAAGDYAVRVPATPVPELAALAGDVNRLATELAETEARRTRLLGDVAHEMRTPLTALDGYVEGMVDGVFAADDTTLRALTDELRRLHRLADDLGQLSRAEEGRLELRIAPCDLAAVCRHAAERLAAQFADAGIRLLVDAPAPVAADADAARVEQVLTNLLGNALAATPRGGSVQLAVARGPGTVGVTVTDTGVGLAAGDLERVFERFYRARAGRSATGSGIGLTIARSIARAHGGELVAASPGPGRGARFTLTLPAPATAGFPAHGDGPPRQQPGRPAEG